MPRMGPMSRRSFLERVAGGLVGGSVVSGAAGAASFRVQSG
jgi:hypothetical protein